MASTRQPGRRQRLFSAAGLLAGLTLSVAGLAQVSGEILVGRVADPLVPGLPSDGHRSREPAQAGELSEPELIVVPPPLYPRAARAARQEGRVMVCFTLDERGRVHMPVVRASSDPVFNPPVLEAINAARFTPARLGTQAVRSTACRTFRFVLR